MSGLTTQVKGTGGTVPTTSFFGGRVADRVNFLRPKHMDAALSQFTFDDHLATPANFLNQWTLYNQSFGGGSNVPLLTLGGFITAPDGTTNTAQQIVETTANSQHFCQTGLIAANQNTYGKVRLAGFFQYAGRRVELCISGGVQSGFVNGLPQNYYGVKAIFDLQNGVVGVDSFLFGSGTLTALWKTFPARIISFGGGWYLCYIDVFANNFPDVLAPEFLYFSIFLDNGTGSNAESITYAGDGVSGTYGWRTSSLPSLAYGMNNQVFFDDFLDNTRSQFDLTNSKAAGFTWYLQNSTPLAILVPTDPTKLTVSGSVLTIGPGATPFQLTLSTTCAQSLTAPTTFVGQGWHPPILFETRMNFRYDLAGTFISNNAGAWTYDMEFQCGQPGSAGGTPSQNIGLMGREIDFMETAIGTQVNPAANFWWYEEIGFNGVQAANNLGNQALGVGPTIWSANYQYNTGAGVFNQSDSTFYTATSANPNINQPPPGNPTYWTVTSPQPPMSAVMDWTQFFTLQCLVMPWQLGTVNMSAMFINGALLAMRISSPVAADASSPYLHTSDKCTMPFLLYNVGNTGNFTAKYDWCSVIQ